MEFLSWYDLILNILIFFAIVVHMLVCKNNTQRLHMIIIVIGFFAILYFFEANFFIAQTVIVMWVIFNNLETMVSRTFLILLLVGLLFISYSSPLFYFITIIFYVIVLAGFILSAFREIGKMISANP